MPAILAQGVQVTLAGVSDNAHLSIALDSFEWVNQFDPVPFVSNAQRLGSAAIASAFPISANGRSISAQKCVQFVDDFYNRIHISPQILQLGNVASSQTEDLFIWNSFFEPRTLESVLGGDEGVLVTGQADPPLLFNPP